MPEWRRGLPLPSTSTRVATSPRVTATTVKTVPKSIASDHPAALSITVSVPQGSLKRADPSFAPPPAHGRRSLPPERRGIRHPLPGESARPPAGTCAARVDITPARPHRDLEVL